MSLGIGLEYLLVFLLTHSQTVLITFFVQAVRCLPLLEWSSDVRFLKAVHNMVLRDFSHFLKLNNLGVFPSQLMKLNYGLLFAHFYEYLIRETDVTL